jgi:hypothetical protein
VLAIKGLNGQLLGLGVQATDVHINAIGVRPGGIKGFDTTVTAEGMPGNTRAKSVGAETICAAEEFEVRQRQNQVQVTAAGADGTITVNADHFSRCLYLKLHLPAVATSGVLHICVPW